MLRSLSYSVGHSLFREEIQLSPQEVHFKRYLGPLLIKQKNIAWSQVESFRIFSHDQFRPMGKSPDSPDLFLVLFHRWKKNRSPVHTGIFLNSENLEAKEILEFFEQALGPKKNLAPKFFPYRYLVLALIAIWIGELIVMFSFVHAIGSMIPVLLVLWLTFLVMERIYQGW